MSIYEEIKSEMETSLEKLDMIYRVNDYFQVFIKEEFKSDETVFIKIDKQIRTIISLCTEHKQKDIIANNLLEYLETIAEIKNKNIKMLRQFLKLEVIVCLSYISKLNQIELLLENS